MMRPNTRVAVYHAIDTERDYQDKLPPSRTVDNDKTVGDYVTILQHYQAKLVAAWTTCSGTGAALEEMRIVAAIVVRCMEEHGAPVRVEKEHKPQDPVFFKPSGTWWHTDETWSDEYGPFDTEDDARTALDAYVLALERGEEAVLDGKQDTDLRGLVMGMTGRHDADCEVHDTDRCTCDAAADGESPQPDAATDTGVHRVIDSMADNHFRKDDMVRATLDIFLSHLHIIPKGTVGKVAYAYRGGQCCDIWFNENRDDPNRGETYVVGTCDLERVAYDKPRPEPVNVTINVQAENAAGFKFKDWSDPEGGDKLEWLDISDEQWRDYVYPDGTRYRVHTPAELNVKRKPGGDSHRIKTSGGVSVYVAAGWVAIEWDVKEGKEPYKF